MSKLTEVEVLFHHEGKRYVFVADIVSAAESFIKWHELAGATAFTITVR